MFDEHMSGATAALRKTNYFDLLALYVHRFSTFIWICELTWPRPFDKVLELRVFYRETDQKARLYCKSDLRGNKVVACRPVSSLHIYRKESNLLLCRLDKKKKPMHWVNLRFLSYERKYLSVACMSLNQVPGLILFFCAFLALKNIDNSMIGHKLDGHVLQGEVHVFSW